MSENNSSQEQGKESPEAQARREAVEGVKSKLAALRDAVQGGTGAPAAAREAPTETPEQAADRAAGEAMTALVAAVERAQSEHEKQGTPDAAKAAWQTVQEALLGSKIDVNMENLLAGIEDAADRTDQAQKELANLAHDVDDEMKTVDAYLEKFGASPLNTMTAWLERIFEGENMRAVRDLLKKVGIQMKDVVDFFRNLFVSKMEGLPLQIPWLAEHRLKQQIERLEPAQKTKVTDDHKRAWREAYAAWASTKGKTESGMPQIGNIAGLVKAEEKPAEQVVAAKLFGVEGLQKDGKFSLEGKTVQLAQVKEKPVTLTRKKVTRDGKEFTFSEKEGSAQKEVILNVLTPKHETDAGQIAVLLSTGDVIQLDVLAGKLDDAISRGNRGEAKVEIPIGTRTITAKAGPATT